MSEPQVVYVVGPGEDAWFDNFRGVYSSEEAAQAAKPPGFDVVSVLIDYTYPVVRGGDS